MNETFRTLVYVSVAVVVCLVSWATRPVPTVSSVEAGGTVLSDLSEVADANSFEITQYDEELAKLESFSVAKQRGRWVIPSHKDYPADAESQLRKIAGLFVNFKSIVEISRNPKEFELYGVVEPTKDIEAGSKGVGRLITIADKKDTPLVKLIVGKKAEFTGSGENPAAGDELHYVRIAGQDAVHVARIALSTLTIKFEEWIERDLLQMNQFDVKKMSLLDYSIVLKRQGNYAAPEKSRRLETEISQAEDNSWKLDAMRVFAADNSQPAQLADDEELDKTKLDGVKTALDELKIIDVDRKPDILRKAMQDDKLARNSEAQQELFDYGFVVLPNDAGKPQIWGFSGSVRVNLKDGVEYSLIFGRPKSTEKGDSGKLNRYLMVQARVDESMIAKPDLEVEQPEPAGPSAEEPKKEGDDKAEDKAAEAKKDVGDKTEEEIKQDELAKQERERIKRDNQRKLDTYREQVKKAEYRVAELNARFENWFYVVSDDVYKKVQLSRADIVKDRDTARDDGFGIDAFRRLESGGIKGPPKQAASPPGGSPPGLPPGLQGLGN